MKAIEAHGFRRRPASFRERFPLLQTGRVSQDTVNYESSRIFGELF